MLQFSTEDEPERSFHSDAGRFGRLPVVNEEEESKHDYLEGRPRRGLLFKRTESIRPRDLRKMIEDSERDSPAMFAKFSDDPALGTPTVNAEPVVVEECPASDVAVPVNCVCENVSYPKKLRCRDFNSGHKLTNDHDKQHMGQRLAHRVGSLFMRIQVATALHGFASFIEERLRKV